MTNEQSRNYRIEIATTDFITAKAAVEGGADRIELCAALSEGGITPSHGMIKICREEFDVELFPIIRPRGGDFLYTDEEYEVMRKDVLLAKQVGCDGVVIGLLNADGNVDVKRTGKLVELAYPLEVTFHRAFDRSKDPFEAMEQLISIGCNRILTSGQKTVATKGIELIAQLVRAADDRIIIMPGSGVRKENIKELAQKTGAVEFHSSLRSQQKSKMNFIHPDFADSDESYFNPAIGTSEVEALRNALES
ncbi:MAG: copper homeostasis protein CutC [Chitinophagaceae bacterium]|nr:MAG: copper homeostasis protein CutC [Chitinophagaceae bacterium]